MHAAASEATERDRDIIELMHRDGRDRAFEELLRRYESKVYRLCCALVRDRGEAEDAAQESLLRVWKALDRYDGRAALSSWIYAITRNRCLTVLDKRRSLDALEVPDEAAESAWVSAGEAPDMRAERLRALVDRLPERSRRVLVLYYYEERSVSEVALMLGCPQGTVKTTLFRARAALAGMLKCRGLDDPACWQEDGA